MEVDMVDEQVSIEYDTVYTIIYNRIMIFYSRFTETIIYYWLIENFIPIRQS